MPYGCPYFEVSAKDGDTVLEALQIIIETVYQKCFENLVPTLLENKPVELKETESEKKDDDCKC